MFVVPGQPWPPTSKLAICTELPGKVSSCLILHTSAAAVQAAPGVVSSSMLSVRRPPRHAHAHTHVHTHTRTDSTHGRTDARARALMLPPSISGHSLPRYFEHRCGSGLGSFGLQGRGLAAAVPIRRGECRRRHRHRHRRRRHRRHHRACRRCFREHSGVQSRLPTAISTHEPARKCTVPHTTAHQLTPTHTNGRHRTQAL